VAGVYPQHVLEQTPAELGHRGADRQLQSSQAFWPGGGSQRARCLLGEMLCLRRELRFELTEEPLFSAPGPAGGRILGERGHRPGLADRVVHLGHLPQQGPKTTPGRDLPARLVQLRSRRELVGHRLAGQGPGQ